MKSVFNFIILSFLLKTISAFSASDIGKFAAKSIPGIVAYGTTYIKSLLYGNFYHIDYNDCSHVIIKDGVYNEVCSRSLLRLGIKKEDCDLVDVYAYERRGEPYKDRTECVRLNLHYSGQNAVSYKDVFWILKRCG